MEYIYIYIYSSSLLMTFGPKLYRQTERSVCTHLCSRGSRSPSSL